MSAYNLFALNAITRFFLVSEDLLDTRTYDLLRVEKALQLLRLVN